MPSRYIHSHLSSRQVPDLFQAIFVAELMTPSRCLWLVSPWISDIPVIDNSANTFVCLELSWSRTRVHLSQVLATLVCVPLYLEWLVIHAFVIHAKAMFTTPVGWL